MTVKLFSTTPHKSVNFWQIVLLPTISILRYESEYTVVNFEWLFWNISICITHDVKE